jgi:hypothetical protein
MFCPKCGLELAEEAEFCIDCGIKLRDYVPEDEEPAAEIICKACGEGRMLLVEDVADGEALFQCSQCGAYFGNFLRTGIALHYTTEHLRSAQFITNRIVMSGSYSFETTEANRNMEMDCVAAELAKELEMNVNDAKDCLEYLLENGIILKYAEERDGKLWVGLKLCQQQDNVVKVENAKPGPDDELLGV